MILGSIACGIWGFFNIEVLPALMGKNISRIFYYAIGVFGLYGVHFFIEYSKAQFEKDSKLEGQVDIKGSSED